MNSKIKTFIRRSCLTGKIVWIYRGPSENAARMAYCRACKKEMVRIKQWSQTLAKRAANIAHFLSDCTAEIPITAEFTQEQTNAARLLQTLGRQQSEYHRDFYEHVMEEQRQKQEIKEIRRRMKANGLC